MLAAHDSATPTPRRWRPITLRVAGGNLLLSGQFKNWVPLTLDSPSKPGGTAKIIIDVTSQAPAKPEDKRMADTFSFTSRQVRQIRPLVHTARGTLRAGRASSEVDIIFEMAPSHSPFCLASFQVPDTAFGALWKDLESRVGRVENQGDETQIRAHGWLRAPDVAAA